MSDYYDEEEWADRVERFADPGGDSALYAAGRDNPRDLPCPTCHWPNRLTRLDVLAGYQCDSCARAMETARNEPQDAATIGDGLNQRCRSRGSA